MRYLMEEYIDLVVPIKDLGFMITGILNNFESLLCNALTKLLLQRAFSFYIFLNGKISLFEHSHRFNTKYLHN